MLIRQIDQQPLVQMTAREFMFNYTNSLMSLGNNFMPDWITFENLGLIDRVSIQDLKLLGFFWASLNFVKNQAVQSYT